MESPRPCVTRHCVNTMNVASNGFYNHRFNTQLPRWAVWIVNRFRPTRRVVLVGSKAWTSYTLPQFSLRLFEPGLPRH